MCPDVFGRVCKACRAEADFPDRESFLFRRATMNRGVRLTPRHEDAQHISVVPVHQRRVLWRNFEKEHRGAVVLKNLPPILDLKG